MAALAIENARLFEAREERTRSLVSLARRRPGAHLHGRHRRGPGDRGPDDRRGPGRRRVPHLRIRRRGRYADGTVVLRQRLDRLRRDRRPAAAGRLSRRPSHSSAGGDRRRVRLRSGDRARGAGVARRVRREDLHERAAALRRRGGRSALPHRDARGARLHHTSEIELAKGLGEQAAAAIHNARVFAQLGLRTNETELLNEIARKATASLNVVDVARATTDETQPADARRSRHADAGGRRGRAARRPRGRRWTGAARRGAARRR